MKIAATLNLQTVVKVSSKPQLLAVLDPALGLKGLECLSVSGRNMRLWKVDADKAADLLCGDAECAAAITAYRTEAEAAGRRPLLVLAEGEDSVAEGGRGQEGGRHFGIGRGSRR